MKRAVLLVDHGSRRPEANALLERLAAALREREDRFVTIAHLEATEPGIEAGIDACAEAGAVEVTVLPCFLAPGRHTTEDVPARARAAAARHPGLRVRVAEPVGTHPLLIEILQDRLREVEDR